MELINTPIETNYEDTVSTNNLYFCIRYNKKINNLKPDTYDAILNKNGKNFEQRIKNRDVNFRKYFLNHHSNTSFIEAAVIGFNDYYSYNELFNTDDFVFYFKLTLDEINKCVFFLNEDEKISDLISDCQGIHGLTKILKFWNTNMNLFNLNKSKIGDKIEYYGVNILIPFKVDFIKYMLPANKRDYYHGTTKRLNKLNKWSFITPYKEDAISFAVKWDSNDLVYCNNEISKISGRPPHNLCFKSSIKKPRDSKIYLYKFNNINTISTKTNSGFEYAWNRMTLNELQIKEFEIIDSWKKHFKLKK